MFAELSPQEQWYLHDYFRPSEQLSDDELLAHRKAISRQRPSLPQSAGRAFNLLVRMLQRSWSRSRRDPEARGAVANHAVHHIIVRAVVQPKPDVDMYARAVVQMVMKKHRDDHRFRP